MPHLTPDNLQTMKTKIDKSARLAAAMQSAYIRLYRCESSHPEYDAQRNLQGRTHYVDPDTLKGFDAKILNGGHSKDGLLFWLVETVRSRPNHGGYTRRAIVFDVFGEIVNERADLSETQGEWFKDTRKAVDSALAFVASFDAVKHTADKMAANALRDIETAKKTLAALRGK